MAIEYHLYTTVFGGQRILLRTVRSLHPGLVAFVLGSFGVGIFRRFITTYSTSILTKIAFGLERLTFKVGDTNAHRKQDMSVNNSSVCDTLKSEDSVENQCDSSSSCVKDLSLSGEIATKLHMIIYQDGQNRGNDDAIDQTNQYFHTREWICELPPSNYSEGVPYTPGSATSNGVSEISEESTQTDSAESASTYRSCASTEPIHHHGGKKLADEREERKRPRVEAIVPELPQKCAKRLQLASASVRPSDQQRVDKRTLKTWSHYRHRQEEWRQRHKAWAEEHSSVTKSSRLKVFK